MNADEDEDGGGGGGGGAGLAAGGSAGLLQRAVLALQTPSSSLHERIVALRQLRVYVGQHRELDEATRANINQLVLDNVLGIVLSEDRTTDLRRRQLLRTECFLMLASLLTSQTLFRGIDQKLVKLAAQQRAELSRDLPSSETKEITSPGYDDDDVAERHLSSSSSMSALESSKPKPRINRPPPGWVRSPATPGQAVGSPASSLASPTLGRRPPTSPTSILAHGPGGKHSPPSPATTSNDDLDVSVLSASASWAGTAAKTGAATDQQRGSRGKGPDLSLIKPIIAKAPRLLLKNKKLRPRPSVFFNSEAEFDGFVPGVDPTNYIEQDRRLGYQKPRTWFPSMAGSLDRRMVPVERNQGSEAFKPDRIVEEYMQMKALLSYVGDLVMPYSGKSITRTAAGNALLQEQGSKARPLARLAGVLDQGKYDTAVREAVSLWSPLLGAHLPAWAKPSMDAYDPSDDADAQSIGSASLASSSASSSVLTPATHSTMRPDPSDPNPHPALQKAVLVSQDALKRLLKKEVKGAARTGGLLRDTLHMLTQSDSLTRDRIDLTQGRLQESLSEEKHTVEQTIAAIQTLTKETIRLQYASLPARYLLVVEGKKANPRIILAKVTLLFYRTRRRNLLAMALGTWKICLLEGQRKTRAIQYAKVSAIYLLREWVTTRKFRQMRKWTRRWRLTVRRLIFDERNTAVLPLQTLYRRWRDRCIIIRMHLLGPYNGPLSDIFLGAWRPNIWFRIPKSIRNSRRMFWQAAVQIQTRWRLFYLFRETRERRKKVILLQSVIRMWPKRMQFLRLKKWTIKTQAWMRRTVMVKKHARKKIMARFIQKYVRRYLGQLWRDRGLIALWKVEERRLGAAILIQTRWREYSACSRVARIRAYLKKRDWAVLVLQRQWYKQKNAYHTFFLMCALRATTEVDAEFARLVYNMRRYYSARQVQRVYAIRFFRRNLTSAIKLQCWWRGRLGYSLVDLKRKQLWASRKLHHWARGMLRRKNARVRKIQRCWWNYKKGSLLLHLAWRARLRDERFDAAFKRRRYFAACAIQAHVHGMWCRYWVKRHRAALKIQPPLRFYLARQRWKRQKREQNHNKVHKFVQALTNRLMMRRVKQILKLHSDNFIKPQALVRGWLVRRRFSRARKAAHVYGQAVLRIQRCYRKSGAMAAAVAEVMAIRRRDTKPFRGCQPIHSLLIELRKKYNRLYNYRDPRAGLRVPAFLYRMGLPDLIPMFPRKEFATVQDFQGLGMERLYELHDEWMEVLDKAARGKGTREAGNKKKEKPVKQFQLFLDMLKPPMGPRAPSQQNLVSGLLAVQNCISPHECGELVYNKFFRKFGENHISKAHNFSEKIVHSNWIDYNNILSFGVVTTLRLLHRCIDDCSSAGDVAPRMDEFRDMFPDVADDLKWNKKRVSDCASVMQLAFERAMAILNEAPPPAVILSPGETLPEDPVKTLLEKVGARILSYKRKFGFMRDRFTKEKQRQAKEQAANPNKVWKNHHEPHWALPEDGRERILTVEDCADLPFSWEIRAMSDLDFEFNTSIAQLYQQTFEKLVTASMGIQGLKSTWKRNSIRRVFNKEREHKFVTAKTDEYLHMVNANHVQRVWKEFHRKETVVRMFQLRIKEAAERRALVVGLLKWVPRFGWAKLEDDEGTPYWEDQLGRGLESTYEMPIYTFDHWKAVCVLQRRTQAFLDAIKERKRLKEVEKQRQLALIEAAWLEQLKMGQKKIKFSLKITPNGISALIEREKSSLALARKNALEIKAAESAVGVQGAVDDGSIVATSASSEATEKTAVAEGSETADKDEPEKESKREDAGDSDAEAEPKVEAEEGDRNGADVAESKTKVGAAASGGGASSVSSAKVLKAVNAATDTEAAAAAAATALRDAEMRLPWRYSFSADPKIISGMWCLMATPYAPAPPPGLYPYPVHSSNDYGMGRLLKSRAQSSRQKSSRRGRGRDSSREGGSRDGGGAQSPEAKSSGLSSSRGDARSRNGNATTPGSKGSSSRVRGPQLGLLDDWGKPGVGDGSDLTKATPYKAISAGFSYEVVVVFALRKEKGSERRICDCRTVKGERHNAVDMSRLFVMNIEKGMGVECRWKRQRAFYRGTVQSVGQDHLLEARYAVRYDDGEQESGISRDMLRPSAASLDEWFDARNRELKQASFALKRQQHFAAIRAQRVARLQSSAFEAERAFALHWMWTSGATPSAEMEVPESVVADHKQALAADQAAAAAAAEAAAARKGRSNSTFAGASSSASTSAPGSLPAPPAKQSLAWQGLRAAASRLQILDKGIKVVAEVNQVPFRFGWGVVRSPTADDPHAISFFNRLTKQTSTVLSVASHRPSDEFYARKLQAAWAVRKARVAFRRLLYSDSVDDIVDDAVKRVRKIAFVGFRREGVMLLHQIRRCGFSEVAVALEKKFKLRPKDLAALTIEGLADLPPDRFESIGVSGAEDARHLKNLQKWWKGTTPLSRDKGLRFVNWFNVDASFRDEPDRRTLRAVLQSGDTDIYERFAKLFPQSLVRCQNAAKRVVSESLFPVTFAQVDNYLKKWGDKADLATGNNLQELISKATTSTWVEEKEAYAVLWGATRRLLVIYGNLGLRRIRDHIRAAEEESQELLRIKQVREKTLTGGQGPGLEGRAAHLLRTRVFEYLIAVRRSIRLIQKTVRGFIKRSKFKVLMKRRFRGVRLLQRWLRGCSDRRLARALRIEQVSDWEQMWDPMREIVYFFNHVTGKSTYMEPRVPYRPLVRDRRSQALVQAWPFLDKKRAPGMLAQTHASATVGLAGKHSDVAPGLVFCAVCQVRRCVRMCDECEMTVAVELSFNGVTKVKKEQRAMPYCFPCFTQAHGENTDIAGHAFTVVSQPASGPGTEAPLLCVTCDDAATRKCLGILDDAQIDELCSELSRTHPRAWPQLLARANVGGERKLRLILEDVLESRSELSVGSGGSGATGAGTGASAADGPGSPGSPGSVADTGALSPGGGGSVASRSMGGASSYHSAASLGRREEYHVSALQLQKMRQALERTRAECDECYCDDCYRDVHSGGKRSLHRWLGFSRNAPVCSVCVRSPATERCVDCGSAGYCATCFRVFHAMGRKRKHRREPIRDELFPGQTYCQQCDRRASAVACPNPAPPKAAGRGVSKFMDAMEAERGIDQGHECAKRCCEACFECIHKPACDAQQAQLQVQRAAEEAKKEAARAARDPAFAAASASMALLNLLCVACGEPADQKCVQCGDAYCSKTWMGNEGCFLQYHRKGKRAEHKTVSLESLAPQAPPEGGWAAWAKK